jgi:hypothetical protein
MKEFEGEILAMISRACHPRRSTFFPSTRKLEAPFTGSLTPASRWRGELYRISLDKFPACDLLLLPRLSRARQPLSREVCRWIEFRCFAGRREFPPISRMRCSVAVDEFAARSRMRRIAERVMELDLICWDRTEEASRCI